MPRKRHSEALYNNKDKADAQAALNISVLVSPVTLYADRTPALLGWILVCLIFAETSWHFLRTAFMELSFSL